MRRRALALLSGILLLGLVPGSTLATVATKDQSYTSVPESLGAGSINLAQTFTAGITGSLMSVDLWMNGDGAHPITVTIESTSGGLPTGTVLATSESGTPPTGSGGWTSFSFSAPYSQTALTTYAIVFETGGDNAVWGSYVSGSSTEQALAWDGSHWGAVAAGGSSYYGDFAFETWVEAAAAPTPTVDYVSCTDSSATVSFVGVPTGDYIQLENSGDILSAGPPPDTGFSNVVILRSNFFWVLYNSSDVQVGDANNFAFADDCPAAASSPSVSPSPTPTPVSSLAGATAAATITPPPTSTDTGGSSNGSAPLLALLICLAFSGLGLAAVETQRRRIGS
jgi:hypothetical protein